MLAAGVVLVSGCTTLSTPTTWAKKVTLADGSGAYEISCAGMFGSHEDCASKAQEICSGMAVVNLDVFKHKNAGGRDASIGSRDIIFQCKPVVEKSVPPPPPQPPGTKEITIRDLSLQGDTNFEFDSPRLTSAAESKLNEFLKTINGQPLGLLRVVGHTDSVGSNAYNDKLSLARAQSVFDYLSSHGLKAKSVTVEGRGKREPVASNATAEGRATNRRVDIQIQGNSTTTSSY